MRICYFFTISLCLRVTNTIKIITGAGEMQSPFSASIHGWSCAVLAHKTENPGQTETLLSPWQWLILCVPAQFLKAIRILHNPCYKTVDTHELLYIHLSTCLPSDNSVKIIFVKWGTRVVSFPRDPKALCNRADTKHAGEQNSRGKEKKLHKNYRAQETFFTLNKFCFSDWNESILTKDSRHFSLICES